MSRVSILEAVAQAKKDLLPVEGVVGVSHVNTTIIVYVETAEDAKKVPNVYLGYAVQVKVVGRVRLL